MTKYARIFGAGLIAAALSGCGSLPTPTLPKELPVSTKPAQYFADEISRCRSVIAESGRLKNVDFVVARAADETPGQQFHTLMPKHSRDIVESVLIEIRQRVVLARTLPDDEFIHPGHAPEVIVIRGGPSFYDSMTEAVRHRNDISMLPGRGRGSKRVHRWAS